MIQRHLDNAATSHPKPPEIAEAMARAMSIAGNPGRGSGTGAAAAKKSLEDSRDEVARFVGASAPRVAFTLNATDALNLAIAGLAPAGSRVVVTELEHGAVMRPLLRRAREGSVALTRVAPRPDGRVDAREIAEAARGAALVAVTLASNVTGVVQPLPAIAALLPPGTALLVDGAQAAGSVAIDVGAFGRRAVTCLTGHKALLGPMGCGALVAGDDVELPPWREGGTGDGADEQPLQMPQRLEAGTPPLPAIAGLAAGLRWWSLQGPAAVRAREQELLRRILDALRRAGASVAHGDAAERVPLASFALPGWSGEELAHVLQAEHGIAVRAGLHCAPSAHRLLGTWPEGLVRVSIGPTTPDEDVAAFCDAIRELVS